MVLLSLGACGASPLIDKTSWSDRLAVRQGKATARDARSVLDASIPGEEDMADGRLSPVVEPGTDQLVASDLPDLPQRIVNDKDRGTLNLVRVPLAEAAKTILGDILGLNYSIDSRVDAEITLQTTQPLTKAELVANFQAVLRAQGAAVVERSGFYRIIPSSEVARAGPSYGNHSEASSGIGVKTEVMEMRFVSAEAMREIIEPIAAEGAVQRIDAARNAIIVSGTEDELLNIRQTIAIFDVDWMKGMSFAL
ncbi:MAG TPA: secretin N-terminal domain-containing protein [Aestuariivirgaceae bacterium]